MSWIRQHVGNMCQQHVSTAHHALHFNMSAKCVNNMCQRLSHLLGICLWCCFDVVLMSNFLRSLWPQRNFRWLSLKHFADVLLTYEGQSVALKIQILRPQFGWVLLRYRSAVKFFYVIFGNRRHMLLTCCWHMRGKVCRQNVSTTCVNGTPHLAFQHVSKMCQQHVSTAPHTLPLMCQQHVSKMCQR